MAAPAHEGLSRTTLHPRQEPGARGSYAYICKPKTIQEKVKLVTEGRVRSPAWPEPERKSPEKDERGDREASLRGSVSSRPGLVSERAADKAESLQGGPSWGGPIHSSSGTAQSRGSHRPTGWPDSQQLRAASRRNEPRVGTSSSCPQAPWLGSPRCIGAIVPDVHLQLSLAPTRTQLGPDRITHPSFTPIFHVPTSVDGGTEPTGANICHFLPEGWSVWAGPTLTVQRPRPRVMLAGAGGGG